MGRVDDGGAFLGVSSVTTARLGVYLVPDSSGPGEGLGRSHAYDSRVFDGDRDEKGERTGWPGPCCEYVLSHAQACRHRD